MRTATSPPTVRARQASPYGALIGTGNWATQSWIRLGFAYANMENAEAAISNLGSMHDRSLGMLEGVHAEMATLGCAL